MTSHEALTKQFGLSRSRLDPSLSFGNSGKESLILVVQQDEYLYAAKPRLSTPFESFLQTLFRIGTLKANDFDIMEHELFMMILVRLPLEDAINC